MLTDVKTALRINNTAYDIEVLDLIEAAKVDLHLSGVNKVIDADPLIRRAITIYAKANFGWNNPDSEKLQRSYDMLKCHLALSQEYTVEAVE